jgi:Protein of unknown function (DUF3551)
MKKVMTAAFALSALFAVSGKAHAEVNYPWCIIGDTRAIDCYFPSREQCMQDGRNRGFGSQCIQNPAYKPGAPTISGSVKRPTIAGLLNERTVSATARPSKGTFDVCAKKADDLGLSPGHAGRANYIIYVWAAGRSTRAVSNRL